MTPASVTRGDSAVPLAFPARSSSATAHDWCAALTGVIESSAQRRPGDRRPRPRYGVDGFPYLAGLSAGSAVLVVAGALAARLRHRRLAAVGVVAGLAAGVPALLGVRYVARGKFALRDRVLDAVDWRGDETVVDLGCGAGLLGLGAASRTAGAIHAVDLFIAKDLSGNSPDRLLENAEALGVADRVQLHVVDVRATELDDHSVDVVLSTLCLHNLGEADARASALDEIVRILRPGGTVVLTDLAHVDDEYAPHLTEAGLTVTRIEKAPGTFPPQKLLVARAAV